MLSHEGNAGDFNSSDSFLRVSGIAVLSFALLPGLLALPFLRKKQL